MSQANDVYLQGELAHKLKAIRHGRDNDEGTAAFYMLLGMLSAACTLGAIDYKAASRLSDLGLNASKYRSDELAAAKQAARAAAKAAELGAAA